MFFDPSTAPLPPRPACRPSWEMVANRTLFSPAGPIEAIRNRESKCFRKLLSQSGILKPHKSGHASIRTLSFSTTMMDGCFAAPMISIASNPVRLPAMAKPLPASESLIRPVNGLLETTANFADVVSALPTNGLKTKNRLARESNGSNSAEAVCKSSSTPKPAPPIE